MASKNKTESTGKPARSSHRKRRVTRRQPKNQPHQPTQNDQSPALQVKPEPTPPTEGEQKILDLLWTEFARSDEVARAAARFEIAVHERLVQQRQEEGFSEDEAGDVRRVFRSDDFNSTYRKLMTLRMERLLIKDLELDAYEDDIMRELIRNTFSPPPTPTKTVKLDDRLQIGNDEIQQIRQLKSRGRRGR